MKHIIFLTVTASALAFCTKQKSNKKSTAAPGDHDSDVQEDSGSVKTGATAEAIAGFLRVSELSNPGSLRPTSATDIVNTVSSIAQFYRIPPVQTSAGGCISTVLGRHTYNVDSDQISAKFFETDLAACFQADPSFSGAKVTKATLNFQHMMICPEGDLRRFKGAKIDAAQNFTKPEECLSELFNLSAVIYATVEKNNTKNLLTRTVNIARIGGGQVAEPGSANKSLSLSDDSEQAKPATKSGDGAMGCVMTSDGDKAVTSNGCQTITSTSDVWIPAIYPDNAYSQLADKDLKLNPAADGPYFAGGEIAFYINGWKGLMTYAGPTVQPTWDARYGTSTVASGTFGTPAAKKPVSTEATAKADLNLDGGIDSKYCQLNYVDLANAALSHPLAMKPQE